MYVCMYVYVCFFDVRQTKLVLKEKLYHVKLNKQISLVDRQV